MNNSKDENSLVEEDLLFKILWQLTNNVSFLLSIFGSFIFLLDFTSQFSLDLILIGLFLGIVLKLALDLLNKKSFSFLGNLLPFIFSFTALVFYYLDYLNILGSFFLFFGLYSVLNALGELLLKNFKPVLQSLFFGLKLTHKLFWFFVIIIELNHFLGGSVDISVPFLNNIYPAGVLSIYVISNLIVSSVSFFLSMLLLIVRNGQLSEIGEKLEKISCWSLDKEVLSGGLLENEITLSKTNKTILFGDIRGFTGFSENNDIESVLKILENFYRIAEKQVLRYGGYKPEFIADEFVTFFPTIKNCISCALELNYRLNKYLRPFGLGMGIGIDRGKVLEGILGGESSKKYTVLGRAVNTAARLQSKARAGEVLITERIMRGSRYLKTSRLEGVKLKGIDRDLNVYRVKGLKKVSIPKRKNFFQKIMEKFKRAFEKVFKPSTVSPKKKSEIKLEF